MGKTKQSKSKGSKTGIQQSDSRQRIGNRQWNLQHFKKMKKMNNDDGSSSIGSSFLSSIIKSAKNALGLGTSSQWSSTPPQIDISDSEDEMGDDFDEEICFGTYRGNIVGLRYYRGTVNNKEMVALQRDPHNKYDCNAIRVDNVEGIQVGHIKRELAVPLAYICDNGIARIEGVVPYGAKNPYSMPVDLTLWGLLPKQKEAVDKLRQHGYLPTGGTSQNLGHPVPGISLSVGYDSYIPRQTYLTPAEVKNELDKLFENIREEDKTSTIEPAEAIRTKLYPHQKQALNWMIKRENGSSLPPFWEEIGGKYFNSVTNFTSNNRPKCVHGGILADDMGLGKTLEIIALILTNFEDNKPLAVCAPGFFREIYEQKLVSKPCVISSQTAAVRSMARFPSDGMAEVKLPDLKLLPQETDVIEISSEESDSEDTQGSVDIDDSVMSKVKDPTQYGTSRDSARAKRNIKNVVSYLDRESIEDEESRTPIKRASMNMMEETEFVSDYQISIEPNDWKRKRKEPLKGIAVRKKPHSPQLDVPVLEELPDIVTEVDLNYSSPAMSTCGQSSGRTSSQGPRTTLIVCPLSVISNWLDQFEKHIHESVQLKIYQYCGTGRIKDNVMLAEQDIVLTTYSTMAADHSKGSSPLEKVEWLRIVLDEGHAIRNPSTKQTKAVLALNTQRKWVVTGTPIQNSMKDLWSLINFLQICPFTDRQWWYRTIERPLKHGDESALIRIQHLMSHIALRRTKNQKVNNKPLIELPERKVYLEHIILSRDERDAYEVMQNEGKHILMQYFRQGTLLHNYGYVLAILMRLRQLCCHPFLVPKVTTALKETQESGHLTNELQKKLIDTLMTVLSSGSDEECAICLESLKSPVITPCAHVYCRPCIEAVIKNERPEPKCPLCRGNIEVEKLLEMPPEGKEGDKEQNQTGVWKSSTKVDALMNALLQLRSQDQTVKSIVVSQFTSFLNLLELPLSANGFQFVRLDGSMKREARTQAIQEFNNNTPGSPTIFLLSFKAGGVGINLTAASRIFLLDPAWNPASEEQCFDRCHRLGQTKEVIITKFIVEDSVETRMMLLQEKKRQLMQRAFGQKESVEEKRQAKIRDIKSLIDL